MSFDINCPVAKNELCVICRRDKLIPPIPSKNRSLEQINVYVSHQVQNKLRDVLQDKHKDFHILGCLYIFV